MYEYCNLYIYVTQLALIGQYDYGFISELTTRFSILIAEELQPMLKDIETQMASENVDWYLIGFRFGMFWKLIFDVQFN